MSRRFTPLAAALVVLLTAIGAAAQTAENAPTFSIVPEPGDDPAVTERGYFIFELAPGAVTEGGVRLENAGTEPLTIELAAVDATTAQGGGGSYAAAEAEPTRAGAWLHLDAPRVRLEPGGQATVGFTVRVPESVEAGQYLAGIVAYVPVTEATVATPAANQAGAAVILQPRGVVSVQLDVPGDWTPFLTITGARVLELESGTQLAIGLRNGGDTFLRPEGSVTLTNAAATPIASEPIALGLFLPGTDLTHVIPWPEAPNPGDYGVAVELGYADDQIAHYSGTLTVSESALAAPVAPDEEGPADPAAAPSPSQSWIIYAVGAVLALAVALLALLLLRGSRRPRW